MNPETGVVGISSEKATDYYKKALAAAEEVINSGKYSLMRVADDATPQEKADNFFKAVCEKNGNTEVIWSRDYIYPGQTHGYTKSVQPHDGAEDGGNSRLSALLNLVEAFEPIATDTPGEGAKFDVGTKDNPKFYTNPEDLFVDRDPRLQGQFCIQVLLLEIELSFYKQDNGLRILMDNGNRSWDRVWEKKMTRKICYSLEVRWYVMTNVNVIVQASMFVNILIKQLLPGN